MDPSTHSDCSPSFVEERGRGDHADTSGGSQTRVQCDISTVLSGENAFIYGGVAVDDPENLSFSSSSDYEWASRDVSEFPSAFDSKPALLDWANDSCICRTLGYGSCVKLIACGEKKKSFMVERTSKIISSIFILVCFTICISGFFSAFFKWRF